MTCLRSRQVLRQAIWAVSLTIILFAIATQAVAAEEIRYELFTIEVDGSNLTKLHQRDGWSAGSPRWSTNGKRIAYDSWPNNETYRTSEVVITDANGNGPRYLGPGAMPSWSKNDTKIAYHQYSDRSGVAIISIDGTGSRRIGFEARGFSARERNPEERLGERPLGRGVELRIRLVARDWSQPTDWGGVGVPHSKSSTLFDARRGMLRWLGPSQYDESGRARVG